jgi:cytosine/adenosine deaminase-related metal-dependent hydrolase
MIDLLLHNGRLVTWNDPNEILEDHALLLRDGRIFDLGSSDALRQKYPDAERLDARGQLMMPGNICAHTHFYGAFARGMGIPGPAPKDFPDILERLWWRLDRALLDVDVQYSALVSPGGRHQARHDDPHRPPRQPQRHRQLARPDRRRGGIGRRARALVLRGDRPQRRGRGASRHQRERALHPLGEGAGSDLLAATFGLHASLSLSDKTLEKCVAAAEDLNTGFHIHVAEHEADEYDSRDKYGKRVVDRLATLGILGPKSIVAHAIHIDAREMAAARHGHVGDPPAAQQYEQRRRRGPDIESMLRLGIPVCLGNDGMGNAMWGEWKEAYFLHKLAHRDPRRGQRHGRRADGRPQQRRPGPRLLAHCRSARLAVGAAADVILVDYHATTPLSAATCPGTSSSASRAVW